MQTVMVYSEAGGVSKTTTAVSLAMTAAEGGHRTVLIDLDPRGAATKWTRTAPVGEGLHVGSILGAKEDPLGWAEDLAVQSPWHELLRVIPSARELSNRESDREDFAELRLKASLTDLAADVVVIDCANRQGGPLTLSALHAADSVLYAATASDSGVDGVSGAKRTVEAFRLSMARLGAATDIEDAGVAMTRIGNGFMSYAEQDAIDQVREAATILEPIVPYLAIVPESRLAREWYGAFRKGAPVREAYTQVMRKVVR